MRGRLIAWIAIVAFSAALGQLVWGTFGPCEPPNYFVGGETRALASPVADAKQLYLRRDLYLREPPPDKLGFKSSGKMTSPCSSTASV